MDYGERGAYVTRTRGLPTVPVPAPYHSTHLLNAKARNLLGWRSVHALAKLTETAFNYSRATDDPRMVWYPG